jgi:D-lactate dehydrogenase
MKTIVFFETKPYDKASFEKVNARQYGFKIRYLDVKLTHETAVFARDADAVCVFVNSRVDVAAAEELEKIGIKLIALRCAGFNNIDLKSLYGKIRVVRVPAYSPYAIAEHATALLLCMTRFIHKAYNRVREGNFLLNGLTGRDLHGKTAGIVGTGKIGKITASILKGFGMKLLVYDKFPDPAWAESIGAEYTSFERLCAQSDALSLHSPLTPETRHMINEKTLGLMKEDAVLINTGRGALIDTKALVKALKHKKIGGAGLDVYEEEENYFFEDRSGEALEDDILARLLTFPNVLITGHQAFLTEEALGAIAETTLENIRQFFDLFDLLKDRQSGRLENEICWEGDTSA